MSVERGLSLLNDAAMTARGNGRSCLLDDGAISRQSLVVVSKDQLSCDLVGECVVLNLNTGVYYGLDSVGARIWALVQEPKRVSDVLDIVLEEYDVEPERCESELLALLNALKEKELIETR
jgi:hypothetical protein